MNVPRDLTPIPTDHLTAVCRPGAGADTCRYLTVAEGWSCAKWTSMHAMIDDRVAAGTMGAQGDNCPGIGL
jgi:hypothetical protein